MWRDDVEAAAGRTVVLFARCGHLFGSFTMCAFIEYFFERYRVGRPKCETTSNTRSSGEEHLYIFIFYLPPDRVFRFIRRNAFVVTAIYIYGYSYDTRCVFFHVFTYCKL